jgi:hypothetical protein
MAQSAYCPTKNKKRVNTLKRVTFIKPRASYSNAEAWIPNIVLVSNKEMNLPNPELIPNQGSDKERWTQQQKYCRKLVTIG